MKLLLTTVLGLAFCSTQALAQGSIGKLNIKKINITIQEITAEALKEAR